MLQTERCSTVLTVDESHVDTNQQHDRLTDQHTQWSAEVLLYQLSKIHFNFFLLGVYAPVLGSSPELGSLADKNDRWIGLSEKDEIQPKCGEAHDGCQILYIDQQIIHHGEITDRHLCPPPANRHGDEACAEDVSVQYSTAGGATYPIKGASSGPVKTAIGELAR